MWVLIVAMLGLFPTLGHAAYVDAEVVSNDVHIDGRVLLVLAVRGDAGEVPVQLKYFIPSNPSMQELRYTIASKIQELNTATAVSKLAAAQPGQVIAPLARPAPSVPALTAKQIWRGKFDRYNRNKDAGITAANGEITAMKADLEATYQAGYLD